MASTGSGTIYKRGDIYWVKLYVDGRPVYHSSKSTKRNEAVKLRDQLIAKRHRGQITGGTPDKVLIGELLDDVLRSNIAESTRKIWKLVIEANIRPFFANTRAAALSTDLMERYREKRKADGCSDATANRELSILRTAFHKARKRTPPKVHMVPHFPMVKETTVRQGYLSDDQYAALLNALPDEVKPIFVAGYVTGMRRGELLAITWDQVDFEAGVISLPPSTTKNREGRVIPLLAGDMLNLITEAKRERDENWPECRVVFSRSGEPIKDFRASWDKACEAAGVPDLTFHDLRRTAVRNMRRAGVPQVVRMKISGHKTDSMERRYNIVDTDDLEVAKRFMEERMRSARSA